jgi:hypothetical protein
VEADMKKRKRPDTIEVFRLLGLATELDRQRVRQLAELGRASTAKAQVTFACADTRNNTSRDEGDAQLEPAS